MTTWTAAAAVDAVSSTVRWTMNRWNNLHVLTHTFGTCTLVLSSPCIPPGDSSCDSICNSGCSYSCDSSCDECPSFLETNTGAVIGIAVGVGALVLGGIGFAVWWSRKNKAPAAQQSTNVKPVEVTPVATATPVMSPSAPPMPPMGIEPQADGTILHA